MASMVTASPRSALPLSPADGAEELFLRRFETVGIARHGEGLRFAYRFATFNDPQHGPLRPGLLKRFPVEREHAKSPPFSEAAIEALIRRDLRLLSHEHLTKEHHQRWLLERDKAVRDGKRQARLEEQEKRLLAPEWAVEGLAAFLELGPLLTRERLEAWGREFADGLDDFRSKKAADEPSRHVPTPTTVERVKDVMVSLFDVGTRRLRVLYADDSPDWLRPWPGAWDTLNFGPNKLASAKRRARTDEKSVRAAMREADLACAAPFIARFGCTDIEIAKDPARFWSSFEDSEASRRWLKNKNITLLCRDRALTLAGLTVGERCPELSSAKRHDLVLDGLRHPVISERHGVVGTWGALFVGASAKAAMVQSAHYCPLAEDACDRFRVMLFINEVLRGGPQAPSDPLFLASVDAGGPARGLTARAIGEAAVRLLVRYGAAPANARATTGFNILRRYTDRAILDWFDEWRRDRDGISPAVTAQAVKEVTLGHSVIKIDPHTYSGLSDDDGRFLLSLYGADVVIQTVYGRLGVRLGPNEDRIRSELAIQRGYEQSRVRIAGELQALGKRLMNAHPAEASEGSAELGRFIVLADQRHALTERISDQQRLVNELVLDRDLWVELEDGTPRLTKRDLRALTDDLLGTRYGTHPPVRDFLLLYELARLLSVDTGTVAGWMELAEPELISRVCPWRGAAPIHRPDARTVLIAAAAIDPDRLGSAERWAALRRLLASWPDARGWHPLKGAKTKAIHALAREPIVLSRPPANDLVASASANCVQVFRFAPALGA